MFTTIVDLAEEIHTDQTSAFPHTSQRGNHYIMVAIHLDANYIFAAPMKNRTEGEMIRTHQELINRMKTAGLGLRTGPTRAFNAVAAMTAAAGGRRLRY
jgi:hypothetical protein